MNGTGVRIKVAAVDERDLLQQRVAIRHDGAELGIVPRQLPVSHGLGSENADARCPHCDSIIYSRRHKLCGLCARALPEDFLFSPAEVDRLESILRTEQERHRRWMRRSFAGALSV